MASKALSTLKDLWALAQGVHTIWVWLVAGGFATLTAFANNVPGWLRIVLAGLGIALACYGLYRAIVKWGYVSLAEAATRSYEKFEGTLYGAAAERMHDERTAEATLDYMGQLLTLHVPVYGRKPPSRVRRRIPDVRVRRGVIEGGGHIMRSNDDREPDWTDLAVRRWDLWKGLRTMRLQEDARKKAWGE